MQSEFVIALLEELDGIHTAIQTSGYAEPEVYQKTIDKFDFVMQDIKIVDEKQHIHFTGVSNRVIKENIAYLKKSGKKFVFRVPMIPGIVDTEDNIKAIKELADGCEIEFLRYNALAGAKYEMLGMEYPLKNILQPELRQG
jgi:pyruvate formate lyase activating enzyme